MKNKKQIPQDDDARKMAPMFRGLLAYFPAALFKVAEHSMKSDIKHGGDGISGPNWFRGRSSDHKDCIVRHLIDTQDGEGELYHLTAIAWRSLALLQEKMEDIGFMPGESSVFTANQETSPDTPDLPDPPRLGGHEVPF